MSLFRPIHHTFGPHVSSAFLARSLAIGLAPWAYREGKSIEHLRKELQQFFQGDAFLFATGREAFLALLRAMDIRPGEEIIVQGYTCVVLTNAIHAAGAVPVYVDIQRETLNLNLATVRDAITPRTRAIVCQHTFGIPADALGLKSICDEQGILLVEDCAHRLPDDHQDTLGKYGDALLLSFGRDKAISGVSGGAIVVRTKEIAERVKEEETQAHLLSLQKTWRYLQYPWIYTLCKPFYGLTIGKAFLVLAKRFGNLVPILTDKEKEGRMSPILHKMPNAMAYLALAQWRHRKHINDHRRALVAFYLDHATKRHWKQIESIRADMPLQKFPLFTKHAQHIRSELKKRNIHLDDGWTGCVVCPADVSMDATDYQWGMDPHAEAACEQILSLPTHPTMTLSQARHLVSVLDPFLV